LNVLADGAPRVDSSRGRVAVLLNAVDAPALSNSEEVLMQLADVMNFLSRHLLVHSQQVLDDFLILLEPGMAQGLGGGGPLLWVWVYHPEEELKARL